MTRRQARRIAIQRHRYIRPGRADRHIQGRSGFGYLAIHEGIARGNVPAMCRTTANRQFQAIGALLTHRNQSGVVGRIGSLDIGALQAEQRHHRGEIAAEEVQLGAHLIVGGFFWRDIGVVCSKRKCLLRRLKGLRIGSIEACPLCRLVNKASSRAVLCIGTTEARIVLQIVGGLVETVIAHTQQRLPLWAKGYQILHIESRHLAQCTGIRAGTGCRIEANTRTIFKHWIEQANGTSGRSVIA